MEKKYTILRLNTTENTVTVLMKYGEHTLQQDVPVENFTDKDAMISAIEEVYSKYQSDMETIVSQAQQEIDPAIQALIDQNITIK